MNPILPGYLSPTARNNRCTQKLFPTNNITHSHTSRNLTAPGNYFSAVYTVPRIPLFALRKQATLQEYMPHRTQDWAALQGRHVPNEALASFNINNDCNDTASHPAQPPPPNYARSPRPPPRPQQRNTNSKHPTSCSVMRVGGNRR